MTRASLEPHNEPHRSPGFVQKQPLEVFCKRRYSKKYCKLHRKNTCVGSLFDNIQVWNFVKKILQHWCFPMKYAKMLRTPILKNICERLFPLVSPQNSITKSGGKFGLDEDSARFSNYNLLLVSQVVKMSPRNRLVWSGNSAQCKILFTKVTKNLNAN